MKPCRSWLVLAAVPFLLHCSKIVDVAANLLVSDADEIAMGSKFSLQIAADTVNYPLYAKKPGMNQAVINYIDSIGQQIVSHQTARTGITYHFSVINADTVINAFACPGGYVYVYTGTILNARNEDEIAGVMAHEIGHVVKRHGVQAMVRDSGYSWVMNLLLGDSSSLRSVSNVVAGLGFLAYSRDNELEADSCGVEFSTSGGWNPIGMQTFLELLAQKYSTGMHFDWLSTHPDTDARIKAVKALIATKPAGIQTRPITPKRVSP
jgi:predicted Zn-dependent protease